MPSSGVLGKPDVAYHQILIGWRGPEPLDRGSPGFWASVVLLTEQVGPVAWHSTAGTRDRLALGTAFRWG